jgi:hypothetical protein
LDEGSTCRLLKPANKSTIDPSGLIERTLGRHLLAAYKRAAETVLRTFVRPGGTAFPF